MEFNEFVENVRRELNNELPGEEAQLLMSPLNRATQKQALKLIPNPTPSAILILLYPLNNIPHTILMVRNSYNGHHSGQVSFPGGKVEASDQNLSQTALREFEEEMGVNTEKVEIIGELSSLIIPPSGFKVSPFIGVARSSIYPKPDKIEVAETIESSIKYLFDAGNKSVQIVHSSAANTKLKAPAYLINGNVIWGATAMILSELESLCKRFNF